MPTWNKISETTVSGSSTTTVSLSSIPQIYTDLAVAVLAQSDGSGGYGDVDCNISFKDSGGNLFDLAGGYIGVDFSAPVNSTNYSSRTDMPDKISDSTSSNTGTGAYWLYIHDYSSTTVAKNVFAFTGRTAVYAVQNSCGFKQWRVCVNRTGNPAIDEIIFGALGASDNFLADSAFSLYGINA